MVKQQILRAALRFEFAVPAYCLMPDHVHLLIDGRTERSDLRRFIKRAKQSSGQRYAATARGPLWQDSYYDHVVRREDDLIRIVRYIIENPVRAGLVKSPLDYPFVGSTVWPLADLVRQL
jgi:putative transposase